MKIFSVIFFIVLMIQQTSFKESQLKHSRVKTAYEEKEAVVKKYFTDKKFSVDQFQLFIRAFKKEQKLEVWIKEKDKQEFALLHTYDFCTTSGTLGPKRKEGDLQIPEGVYHISHFNPQSNFYLSLGLNYPNVSDKILSHKVAPGGSIYIHGNCVTIGCIPITDDKIKELYVLAVEARNNGQQKIPVHIFPAKLNEGVVDQLVSEYAVDEKIKNFWKNLEPVYLDFESTKKLRPVKVNNKGEYHF
ncbi:MAG: L,D-transpeptidase family protein [Cyclobacteriaceae bacterium]